MRLISFKDNLGSERQFDEPEHIVVVLLICFCTFPLSILQEEPFFSSHPMNLFVKWVLFTCKKNELGFMEEL